MQHDDDEKSFSECERIRNDDGHTCERDAIEKNVDTAIPRDIKMASDQIDESTVDKMADRKTQERTHIDKMSTGVTKIQYGDENVNHCERHVISTILRNTS